VRLTAQRLLIRHLCPRDDHGTTLETFWADLDLDLTAATLIDFKLMKMSGPRRRLHDVPIHRGHKV
jgi:hypothetical protein